MYKRLKTTSILAGTAMALTISGCSNYSPWSGGKKMLGDVPEATSTSLSVGVTDLLGAPISGAQIKVFEPLGQNLIKDSLQTQVSDDGGFVYFKLSDISTAVKIAVETDADNYMASGRTVTIEPGTGNSAVFKLVAEESTETAAIVEQQKAAGVTVKSVTATASSGKPATTIVAETEEVADSTDATKVALKPTKVEIPTSATIQDANGEPLQGALRLTVARYDSTNDTALETFPGGLSGVILSADNPNELPEISDDDTGEADGATSEASSETNGGAVFQSAGFVAVELVDEQGRIARTLSTEDDVKPVTITMPIAAGTTGPDGTVIEAGDTVPVWSFNTDEGVWNPEGTGIAESDGAGGLQVQFQVNHFSYWNLDYYYRSCTANLTMQSEDGTSYNNGLDLILKRSTGGWRHSAIYGGDGTMKLFNSPSAFKVDLRAKTNSGETVQIKSIDGKPYAPFNLCDNGGAHTVVLAKPVVPDVSMTVNYTNVCSDGSNPQPMSNIDTFVGFRKPGAYYDWLGSGIRTNEAGDAVYNVPVGSSVYAYYYDSRNGTWGWSGILNAGAGGQTYDVETVVPCEDVLNNDDTGGTGGTGTTN